MVSSTPFDRIWDQHVIRDFGEGRALIHVDRHMAHEGTSERAFEGLRRAGLRVQRPELTLGVIDHGVSTLPGRHIGTFRPSLARNLNMQKNCAEFGVRLLDVDDPDHGIIHVVAPHLGFALPGSTYVCGDSHTASCGGVGAWAWGIGTTEVMQVFATQALIVRKPRSMRVQFDGRLGPHIYPKDIVLFMIGRFGVDAGIGHVVQYCGPVIDSMPIEGRLTICNMSIEFGARGGLIAADDVTFEYLSGRPLAPRGVAWDAAISAWRAIYSDSGADYDTLLSVDCSEIEPQVSWGISPGNVIGISGRVPDPSAIGDLEQRQTMERAIKYMDLEPGTPIAGTPIDVAFIGSCTNGRLSDLTAAAAVVRGRKVASNVRALVVPGAAHVKAAAEAAGIDRVFIEAGFEWREAGCSMCVAAGGDVVAPGQRSISSSNRNFEGRQGPGSRTHLASPAMVAAAAVSGAIVDVRRLAG